MKLEKLTGMVLIALIVLAVVVIGACYVMAPESLVLSDLQEPTEPNDPNTGLFLGYIYILLGLTILVTLFAAISNFIVKMSGDGRGKTLIMLGGFGVMLLIMLITYATGDGTPMHIIGYEGDENTSGWLKITDMLLRTAYILVVIAVLAIIASPIIKKLK
ncbi:MAG: hypothetical protein MJZ02_03195 [Paludibacteraceae bacterium]|nr:hypothetical protein [Paludibacteraceae bacterium]